MKRKMVLTGILALSLLASNASANAYFSDTKAHWGEKTINWAVQSDIVKGYPGGTFRPNGQVTEAEFLTMLLRSSADDLSQFNVWPTSYYQFADSRRYPTSGSDEGRSLVINRGKVANIIAATQGTTYTGRDAIQYLLMQGLAKGKSGSATINNYDASSNLTRAEAVAFVKNTLENGKPKLESVPTTPSPPLPVVGDDEVIQPSIPQPTKPVVTSPPSTSPNDSLLLEADPVTQPVVEDFVRSLKIEGNKVTGVVPNIPDGHTKILKYKDISDGKWGVRSNDKFFNDLSAGEGFEINYAGEGGFLIFSIFKSGEGKNDVQVEIPSLQVTWGAKR